MPFMYMFVKIQGDTMQEAESNKDMIVDWMIEGDEQGTMPMWYGAQSNHSVEQLIESIRSDEKIKRELDDKRTI